MIHVENFNITRIDTNKKEELECNLEYIEIGKDVKSVKNVDITFDTYE